MITTKNLNYKAGNTQLYHVILCATKYFALKSQGPGNTMIDLKLQVAAVHAAPVYMNKQATLEKVITLVDQAAEEGTNLVAFPEVFVPGYPYFINCYTPNATAVAAYAAQSVVVHEDLHDVQAACAKRKITVILGVSERMKGGHTLFNSIVTIDTDGTIL